MKVILLVSFFTISLISHGQTFTKLSIKLSPDISGAIKSPKYSDNSGIKLGFSMTVEPTIFTCGAKKQIDFNVEILYLQKGSVLAFHPSQQDQVFVSPPLPITMDYFSFSPSIKAHFWKIMFAKFGPRVDFLSRVYYRRNPAFSKELTKDIYFNPITAGITYSLGISTGKKRTKFICEFLGQNDMTKSAYYTAFGQNFTNFSYLLNFGLTFMLRKPVE